MPSILASEIRPKRWSRLYDERVTASSPWINIRTIQGKGMVQALLNGAVRGSGG